MFLDQIVEKFSGKRILVLGDIMLDHYVWGDVERISPEAPVPVVHVDRDTYSAGGAANVALNLANLGIQTSLMGYCGNDDAGRQLQTIFSSNNISFVAPPPPGKIPTIIKTRVIIRGQQLCRIDREDLPEYYNLQAGDGFEEIFTNELDKVDAVLVSDYAKGVITQSLVDKLLGYRKNGKNPLLIAIDPKPSNNISYNGAGLLTPNKQEAMELAELMKSTAGRSYPLDDICASIFEKHQPRLLVITLGAEGMAICEHGVVQEILPTEARQVFDVSGAGDTVIALLTACLAAGSSLRDAAILANIAAGCVVSHMGTAPITLSELKHALPGDR